MNRDQLLALHQVLCDESRGLMVKKNHDYSGEGDLNPFANLNACVCLGIQPETGVLVRIMDKIMRISSFIDSGVLAVSDESINDTVKDMINYSVLLAGMIAEKKSNATGPGTLEAGK